ncbi:MAG: hypothetical protein K0B16_16765 [Burkholderiaceae bacterium]|nr:hypothetical protein [Burkholderiaceae bacterium]
MIHPLLQLIATQPRLLADHAEAYAELMATEIDAVSALWKRRAVLNAVALCCLAVAAILAGVALMLWAVIPATQLQAPWALIVAPLPPVVAALWCLMAARVQSDGGPFENLRRQFTADMVMLREVAPS